MRVGSRDVVKNQEFAQWEAVLGDYGGQLASFEAVFSPRGNDGRPMKLFNRDKRHRSVRRAGLGKV